MPYDIEKIISKAFPGEPAAVTSDDIALVWLNKPSDAAKVGTDYIALGSRANSPFCPLLLFCNDIAPLTTLLLYSAQMR